MTFRLTIKCDNAAFEGDFRHELMQIAQQAITKVPTDGQADSANVRDTNGNTVGIWSLSRRKGAK